MFGCSIFNVCVCRCEFVLSYRKVVIDMCVYVDCVGNGEMEESSKCACGIVICIDYFAWCVFAIAKSCAVLQLQADWPVVVVSEMTMCVFFCFPFLCWY